jgi:hypothetical protein
VRGGVFAVVAEYACLLLTYAELDGDTPIFATAVQHCRALVYLLVHRTPSSLGQSDKLATEVGNVVHDAAPGRVGGGRERAGRVTEASSGSLEKPLLLKIGVTAGVACDTR